MSVETQITRAILEDHFTPVLRRIAGEQDAYARRTSALNGLGNVLIGAGSAALGFATKSIKVAAQLDEIKKSMAAVEGQQRATFDLGYIDKFAQHSKFTYLDLAEAGKRLALQNVSVKDTLGDIADVAAASGKPLGQIAQLYDALLGGGRVGLALSARGGFSQYGISTKDIFAAAGVPYKPGQNLQRAMTPQQVADAVHKVLMQTGRAGLNEKLATTTLSGSTGMVQDAVTRLENSVGSADLPKTIDTLDHLAGSINTLADVIKGVPGAGDWLIGGGGALVAGGAVLKGVAAWRQYKAILDTARAAGALERAGEEAKVGVAAKEGAAVAASTGRFAALRAMLIRTGAASLGEGAAAQGVTRIMAAGVGTIGLYALAFVGLAADIYAVVGSFQALDDASSAFEASAAAVGKARAQGYDLAANAGRAQGYNALPVWKQYGEELVNGVANFATAGLYKGPYDTTDSGTGALTDAHSRALAKKHGRPYQGVMATMLRDQQAQRDAAAAARRQAAKEAAAAAGSAANDYQLDPALDFKLKQDERRIDLLKAMGGHEKELKAARAAEIADLNTAAGLLERQAAIATDVKKKYDLMDQAAADRQKAKLLALEKSDDRSKLDKHIATILGAGGLGEDEILKRAGIGGAFFAGLGKGKVPQSPLKMALTALAKRPLILNLHLGDKPFAQVKSEIKDDTIQALLHALEGSNPRALYGGN